MSSEIDWDVSKYEKTSGGFDPVPTGDYVVKISKHDRKPIKGDSAANGDILKFTLDISEGALKGRKLFPGLQVWSKAPKKDGNSMTAAEFARGQFRAIVEACGKVSCKNVAELYGIPFVVSVICKAKTKDGKPTDEMENDFKAYKKYERKGDALPTGGGSPAPASSAPWGSAPPKNAPFGKTLAV